MIVRPSLLDVTRENLIQSAEILRQIRATDAELEAAILRARHLIAETRRRMEALRPETVRKSHAPSALAKLG